MDKDTRMWSVAIYDVGNATKQQTNRATEVGRISKDVLDRWLRPCVRVL